MGNPPRATFGYDQQIAPSGPGMPVFSRPRGDFPKGSLDPRKLISGERVTTDTCLNSEKHRQ
jgi:hypothetical protein